MLLAHHTGPLHTRHPPSEHLCLLQAVLKLLLTELVFNVEAEGHWALVLLAVLRMVAAESNELLADGAPSIGLAFAAFGVLDNPFHLLTGWQRAVGITTLAGMDQRLDTALNAQAAGITGALGGCSLLVVAFII